MLPLILIILGIFLLSSLPLYFSVKLLGGRTGLLKVLLVNALVALVAYAVKYLLNSWGGLIAFILMIWIYKEMFRMGWVRSLLAWLLQFAFAVIIFILLLVAGIIILF